MIFITIYLWSLASSDLCSMQILLYILEDLGIQTIKLIPGFPYTSRYFICAIYLALKVMILFKYLLILSFRPPRKKREVKKKGGLGKYEEFYIS